jgi:hypothetical protein
MTYFPPDVLTVIIDFLRPRPDATFCMDTVRDLRSMCRTRGLKVGGRKLDLIERLLNDGCYARPGFWDTKEARAKYWGPEKTRPNPALTLKRELHTEDNWEVESFRLIAAAAECRETAAYNPIAAYHQWAGIYRCADSVVRMHDRFVNRMDRHWKESGGRKPGRPFRGWRPSWRGEVWLSPDRITITATANRIEHEGESYFGPTDR